MLLRGRIPGRRILRSGYRPTGAAAPTPFQTLQAALGADLVGMWEVPATDDATIDVTATRVSSLASMIGGNALAQATGANQPLFRTDISGIGGEACIEMDSSARYLEGALSVAAGRYGIFVVARPRSTSTSANVFAQVIAGADDSWVGADWDANAGSPAYRSNTAFSAGETALTITSPTPYLETWRLFAILPYAAGAQSEIDGNATTPNYATTNALRAFTAARFGSSSFSGGMTKMLMIVTNVTAAYTAAVEAYVAARWPTVGTTLARAVWAGQSNAGRLVIADAEELPGYVWHQSASSGQKIAYWSKAGAGAGYAALLAVLQLHPPGRRPVIVWSQGESDSELEADADAYLAALEQLNTDLITDLGYAAGHIYWVVCRFHDEFIDDVTYIYAGEVDGHLASFVAADTTNRTSIDPNLSGYSLIDYAHWGPSGGPSSALQLYMMDAARDAIEAAALT